MKSHNLRSDGTSQRSVGRMIKVPKPERFTGINTWLCQESFWRRRQRRLSALVCYFDLVMKQQTLISWKTFRLHAAVCLQGLSGTSVLGWKLVVSLFWADSIYKLTLATVALCWRKRKRHADNPTLHKEKQQQTTKTNRLQFNKTVIC